MCNAGEDPTCIDSDEDTSLLMLKVSSKQSGKECCPSNGDCSPDLWADVGGPGCPPDNSCRFEGEAGGPPRCVPEQCSSLTRRSACTSNPQCMIKAVGRRRQRKTCRRVRCEVPLCDIAPPCSDGSQPKEAPPIYGLDGCQTNPCAFEACSAPEGKECCPRNGDCSPALWAEVGGPGCPPGHFCEFIGEEVGAPTCVPEECSSRSNPSDCSANTQCEWWFGGTCSQIPCAAPFCVAPTTCIDGSQPKLAPPIYGLNGCQINHCDFKECESN